MAPQAEDKPQVMARENGPGWALAADLPSAGGLGSERPNAGPGANLRLGSPQRLRLSLNLPHLPPGSSDVERSGCYMPALEVVPGPALQLLGKGVQDHGPPPKSEAHMRPASSRPGKRRNFATGPVAPQSD